MDLGTVIASAWSAGISLYAVVAALGISGRLDWIDAPSLFERPLVIGIALVLFVVELVVDKIPWLDSIWDAIHTIIRPIGGAVIGALAPDQQLPMPVMLGIGALLAISSHSAKAGARALINTSPEPVTNLVASLVEDGLVGVLMTLAIAYPRVAFVVTVVFAIFSTVAAVLLFKATRAVWRRLRQRGGWRSPPPMPPPAFAV
jgi:hypothetical protein